MDAYDNWYGYCTSLTDTQLRNVFARERERSQTTPDPDTKTDSEAAVSACRVIAAERGLQL